MAPAASSARPASGARRAPARRAPLIALGGPPRRPRVSPRPRYLRRSPRGASPPPTTTRRRRRGRRPSGPRSPRWRRLRRRRRTRTWRQRRRRGRGAGRARSTTSQWTSEGRRARGGAPGGASQKRKMVLHVALAPPRGGLRPCRAPHGQALRPCSPHSAAGAEAPAALTTLVRGARRPTAARAATGSMGGRAHVCHVRSLAGCKAPARRRAPLEPRRRLDPLTLARTYETKHTREEEPPRALSFATAQTRPLSLFLSSSPDVTPHA